MNTLRSLRRAADVTQKQLAVAAGVDPATISKWESGLVPVPLRAVPILARMLGVELEVATRAALPPESVP